MLFFSKRPSLYLLTLAFSYSKYSALFLFIKLSRYSLCLLFRTLQHIWNSIVGKKKTTKKGYPNTITTTPAAVASIRLNTSKNKVNTGIMHMKMQQHASSSCLLVPLLAQFIACEPRVHAAKNARKKNHRATQIGVVSKARKSTGKTSTLKIKNGILAITLSERSQATPE